MAAKKTVKKSSAGLADDFDAKHDGLMDRLQKKYFGGAKPAKPKQIAKRMAKK